MNVLIFHLHDMGRYCSPYGYSIKTPHMQAFAEQATVFRNAHNAAPTCSPSRAALLTGQTAHQAGMYGLINRGFDLGNYSEHLGSYLQEHGYDSVYAGIQHEYNPSSGHKKPYRVRLSPSTAEGSADEQAAQAAAEYLDGVGETPFYLWVGTFMPHRPFHKADPRKYNSALIGPPAPLPDTPEIREDIADFMASVEHGDACFGRVIKALERNGLRENTLVILTTDHGIAFPFMKCNLTHHGTGVALIVDYPDNPSRRTAIDALVSHLDVFPTICHLLNLDKPQYLIGNSLVPLMEGEVNSIREDIFAEVNFHAGREIMRSVRSDRYNFIKIFDENPNVALVNIDASPSKTVMMNFGLGNDTPRDEVQLYDLAFDPQERHNLANDPAYRHVRTQFEKRLRDWMERTDDPLLNGKIPVAEGALLNNREQVDPDEKTFIWK